MKYLLFSDIHGDLARCESLVEKSREVDVVIGAGDFGDFRKHLARPIEILSRIEKPTLIVNGNHEDYNELKRACENWESARVLNGNSVTLYDTTFFGIGGATPVTPFGPWSVDISEKDAETLLSSCPSGCVLISHSPPLNCLDAVGPGTHLGSQSIRQCIETKKPLMTVCGHIHEKWNRIDSINNIPVINAGPFGIEYTLGS